jgi:3-hydroxyphenylacetate 6-hydroxylase
VGTAPASKALNRSRKDTPLGKPAIKTYLSCLDTETFTFIQQCLSASLQPIDPLRMLQRMSLSLDLTLCWGRRITLEDPLLEEIVTVEHEIVNMRNTMTNLQDCIPLLRFPWSRTTKKALNLRQRRDAYFSQLNGELDGKILKGINEKCIRAELLERGDVDEEELNLVCLTFISAGMAPTVGTLQWSLAFLAQRPDIQAAAFKSIQEHYENEYKVLGDIDDDQGCEYIVALIKECLRYDPCSPSTAQQAYHCRYFTVARTSLPRSTVKEFVYDNKVVPAGTTVFLNAWACNMGMFTLLILNFTLLTVINRSHHLARR